MTYEERRRKVTTASILLGIGMGGFIDGIVFHQILQIHNMLSTTYPKTTIVNIEVNMVWDGIFHAFCWLMTALGLGLLWSNVKDGGAALSTRHFVGSLIFGFGLFNFVEGIIDHHILHVHQVVQRLGVSMFDYLFLASGVLMLIIGGFLMRSGRETV